VSLAVRSYASVVEPLPFVNPAAEYLFHVAYEPYAEHVSTELVEPERLVALEIPIVRQALADVAELGFGASPDIRNIMRSLLNSRDRLEPVRRTIPLLESQALIRAALGEPYLYRLFPEESVLLEGRLFGWLVQGLELNNREIGDIIAHAVDVAAGKAWEVMGTEYPEVPVFGPPPTDVLAGTNARPTTPSGRSLFAFLTDDMDEYGRWQESGLAEGKDLYMTAYFMFAEAVRCRFRLDADRRDVMPYLMSPIPRRRSPKPFNLLAAEAEVRGALGERGITRGLDWMEVMRIHYSVAYGIVKEMGFTVPQIADLMVKAEARWTADVARQQRKAARARP
jgi:hypothetical protein